MKICAFFRKKILNDILYWIYKNIFSLANKSNAAAAYISL